ncbi:MAG: ABC transporter permease [Rectinema sp.]
MNFATDLVPMLSGAVAAMTPLLFAALGGLFTELTGMLNIALEGLITLGAFFGILGASATGNLALGVAIGVAASTLTALFYGEITLRFKANVFITGLATNLLASGITVVLSQQLFNTKGVVPFELPDLPVVTTGLSRIPLLGPLLFGQNILAMSSWLAAIVAWVVIRRTPFGMRLRATGSNPKAVVALGLKPDRYRLAAILISGASCGLAGSYLSLNLSAYVPNISSGRGWIALVAIYLGGRRPAGILAACLLFAGAEAFSNYAQGFLDVPPDFILAIPYLVTLAALVAGAAVRRAKEH